MNRTIRLGVLALMAVSLLFETPLALAKGKGGGSRPSGFEKGEKKGWEEGEVPRGWSRGEKKGWGESEMPPGLAKKEKSRSEKKHEKKNEG